MGETGNPNIRHGGAFGAKSERARRIARNIKIRASKRLAPDAPKERTDRLGKAGSAMRRSAGTHEARDDAALPRKRRVDCEREPEVEARSQKRRVGGAIEPEVAKRPQKRRVDGAREMRREVIPNPGHGAVGTGADLRKLRYRSGVSYLAGNPVETPNSRERRHCRMRLLARRTGRGANWCDE